MGFYLRCLQCSEYASATDSRTVMISLDLVQKPGSNKTLYWDNNGDKIIHWL